MKIKAGILLFIFSLSTMTGCHPRQDVIMPEGNAAFETGRTYGGIQEYRLLSNDLRVLLMEDHSAPVAAVMVTYEAGSRDEWKGATGAAHMLEHMMFKGTAEYRKKLGTQPARLLETAGAEINATTSYDSTNYYAFLPNDKVSLALDIEAARMRGALLDPEDFASEKTVIQNELERYFDSPMAALYNAVWQKAFTVHTYHHPVIGWREDVAGMSVESLRRFYDRHYAPENAVLTVVGSFKTSEMLAEIAKRYGAIPKSSSKERAEVSTEPEQKERRSVEVQKPEGVQYLMLAFKTPGAGHPDTAGLDLLSAILGSGKTSRLYQKLVQTGMAASVEASGSGTRDPGLLSIIVTLAAASHEEAEQAVLSVLEDLRAQGVTQAELDRVMNQTRAALAFSRDGAFSVAGELSHAIGMGDWTLFTNYLDRASRVKLEDLKRIAQTYLRPERMTSGRLITGSAGGGASEPALKPGQTGVPGEHSASDTEGYQPVPQEAVPARVRTLLDSLGASDGATSYETEVKRFSAGGVKVLLLKTPVQEVVSFSGSMPRAGNVYGANPVIAKLTAQMIDKGTLGRGTLEIPSLLEDRGADIHYGQDTEYVRFQGRCLKKDTELVLGLMAEQLRSPAFLEEEFQKLKEREKVGLKHAMTSTGSQAANTLMRRVFPEGHPLKPVSLEEQLAALERTTLEDVKRFYSEHYGSQNLLLSVAGDVDGETVRASVEKAFQGWGAKNIPPAAVPPVSVPEGVKYETVLLQAKQNADILMGHAVPVTRLDPDFIALSAANAVLGGDFTSRLSNVVRDRYGLTYGIRSGIVGTSERLTGAWLVHMIVNAPVLKEGLMRTFEQLRLFHEQGITAEELQEKKEGLSGQFKTGLATTQSLADQILHVEELGVGPGYLDRFPSLVKAITLDQANSAVRRYFNPEGFTVVAAGTPPENQSAFDFPSGGR